MIRAALFDLSRVLLFAKDKSYAGDLNPLHASLKARNPNYPFLEHFELNNELLKYIKSLKGRFQLHIFTSGTIQDAPEISGELKFFDGIYSAEKLGIEKTDPMSYEQISEKLGLKTSEILLIDDRQENLTAARRAGMQTHLFKTNKALVCKLNGLK